jgi:hypothetical protein
MKNQQLQCFKTLLSFHMHNILRTYSGVFAVRFWHRRRNIRLLRLCHMPSWQSSVSVGTNNVHDLPSGLIVEHHFSHVLTLCFLFFWENPTFMFAIFAHA